MRCAIALVLVVLSGTWVSAQDAASFEVASVKVNAKGQADENAFQVLRPGHVSIRAKQLSFFVPAGFGVSIQLAKVKLDVSRVSRNLAWRTYFDIEAKGSPLGDQTTMMRTLLRERFGLKWHTEVRTVPLYRLTVKQQGKLGPWMKPSTVNCRESLSKDPNAAPPAECRTTSAHGQYKRQIRSAGTIGHLVTRLQELSDLPLIDATGLTGDFSWDFAMPYMQSSSPEFFGTFRDALEDDLGLTLTRTKGPWEVIVIDDVRMPTPN